MSWSDFGGRGDDVWIVQDENLPVEDGVSVGLDPAKDGTDIR